MDTLSETRQIIAENFEIETRQQPGSEAELLEILSKQIEWMMESRTEFLFSLLYRHDVAEPKIVAALAPEAAEPPHIGLAKLVLERQIERIEAKKRFRSPDSEELAEFNW